MIKKTEEYDDLDRTSHIKIFARAVENDEPSIFTMLALHTNEHSALLEYSKSITKIIDILRGKEQDKKGNKSTMQGLINDCLLYGRNTLKINDKVRAMYKKGDTTGYKYELNLRLASVIINYKLYLRDDSVSCLRGASRQMGLIFSPQLLKMLPTVQLSHQKILLYLYYQLLINAEKGRALHIRETLNKISEGIFERPIYINWIISIITGNINTKEINPKIILKIVNFCLKNVNINQKNGKNVKSLILATIEYLKGLPITTNDADVMLSDYRDDVGDDDTDSLMLDFVIKTHDMLARWTTKINEIRNICDDDIIKCVRELFSIAKGSIEGFISILEADKKEDHGGIISELSKKKVKI